MTELFTRISPSEITDRVQVRSIKSQGVDRLKSKIEQLGFQSSKPILVYPTESGYCLLDGNHRLEAAIACGLQELPALVVAPPASELEAVKQARESNEAAETVVPTTFVDDAELVWKLAKESSLKDVAKAMGWKTHQQVAQYNALQKLSKETWSLVATLTA